MIDVAVAVVVRVTLGEGEEACNRRQPACAHLYAIYVMLEPVAAVCFDGLPARNVSASVWQLAPTA